MRRIRVLLTAAAIVGGSEALGASPADAQCSVFSRHPCVPNVCSVLSRHPCVPEPLYPFGENLQLTIVTGATAQPADGTDAVLRRRRTLPRPRVSTGTTASIGSTPSPICSAPYAPAGCRRRRTKRGPACRCRFG